MTTETDIRASTASIAPPAHLTAGVVARAEADGLLDVAYATVDSPVGPLTAVAGGSGLLALTYPEHSRDHILERVAGSVSPRILEAPARLDGIRRELDEYFDGRRRSFDTPVDWSLSRGFYLEVLKATARIAYGATSTYADVAEGAGNRKAVRAAGTGLGSNPIPIVVPCHRVLRTGGALGGYAGGLERKEFLLDLERR